jgi:hypothetical protein
MCLNWSSCAQSTSKLRPRSPNWCELDVLWTNPSADRRCDNKQKELFSCR